MDFLKVFVIISFIIVTIITLKFHPEMHHPLIIEDEHFKLTRISDNLPKSIPVNKTVNVQEIQTIPKQSEINIQQSTQQIITKPVQQTESRGIKTTNIDLTQSNNDIQNNDIQNNDYEEVSLSQMELLKQILNDVTQEYNPQTNKQNTSNQNRRSKNPYMTEREEIIAWNKWRSNIQNQIMIDSNIAYAPLGTIFSFNFVVDKFGNVSNIKVTCSNPNYMYVARDNVKAAISRLQNQPILNFPKGTQRESTVVKGYILMGLEDRYSTPNNYTDYERVTY